MYLPDVVPQALVNIEGEAMLLGALLENNARLDPIMDVLAAEDFHETVHAVIFQAILDTTALGKHASPVTLHPLFQNDRRFDDVGGPGYLAALTGSSSIFVAIDHLAAQIADLAARRRLIASLDGARDRVTDPSLSLSQLVDEADAALVAAVERRETMHQPSAAECLDEVMERIHLIQKNEGKVGTTTGICDLDNLLGGFEPGQLVIMAGRPGMGKTAVSCSIALGAARQGHGVLFASLEMKSIELGMRMATDLCFDGSRGIMFKRVVEATVDHTEMRRIARAREEIKEWPLRVIDAGSVTMGRLALGVRRHKRRMAAQGHELKLVIIDYLQLLQPDGKPRSAYESVSEVSRGLKALAKDAGVAILALAQLNRAVEQRDDKRPMLSDLRDSGQIEQDADAVIFLHREEYYLQRAKPKNQDAIPAWEQAKSNCASRIDFICAKRRNGRIGDETGYFFAHYQAVRGSDLGRGTLLDG